MKCNNCASDSMWRWRPAVNEDGWECAQCEHKPGEPPGFCPQLDHDEIRTKVDCLLLHLAGQFSSRKPNECLLGVSNGTEGDFLTARVADFCQNTDRFDQYIICEQLFHENREHSDYWAKISQGILSGNDQRSRCECGKLATSSVNSKNYCGEHYYQQFQIPNTSRRRMDDDQRWNANTTARPHY